MALKLAYFGQRYNGFEYHANNKTPFPTIEEELWKALVKTKLIFKSESDDVDFDGCDYSKAGRTDKGVSAFGQVIGLRVRSSRPMEQPVLDGAQEAEEERRPWHNVRDELPYPRLLNRVLPRNIRILAWCPSPPEGFSARFSCRQRKYRYFFTQPASCPVPGLGGIQKRNVGVQERDGWLDIRAMRAAAKKFEGSHDFRNFCKLDAEKQITNFERMIKHADIEELSSSSLGMAFVERGIFSPKLLQHPEKYAHVYSFTVWGSAFLWHQVRHMVAILFLVGQGFESSDLVDRLLDVRQTSGKPLYDMADDHPLVLWDCVFPREGSSDLLDSLHWVYPDDQAGYHDRKQAFHSSGDGRYGPNGINEALWSIWYEKKIEEVLAGQLMQRVSLQSREEDPSPVVSEPGPQLGRLFDGGPILRSKGQYVPVLQRDRMKSPEAANAHWLERQESSSRLVASNDEIDE